MLSGQDISAPGCGDEDLALGSSFGHGGDLETGNGGLEGVDRIDFSNDDTSAERAEGVSTALSNVTVTSNNRSLSSNHDIGGTLDTIEERFATSVKVVELGLSDSIIDVDSRNLQLVLLEHLVQMMNTSGGLFGDTKAVIEKLWVLVVDKSSKITTVIEDQVQLVAILEGMELLLQTPVILLLGLTLPGKAWGSQHNQYPNAIDNEGLHRDTGSGNSRGGVILGREDVAR